MANYWIKLYHEILRDPKMGRLPDRVWRRCIELFLLAGEYRQGGALPPIDEISWILRVDETQLDADMDELRLVGILTYDGLNQWRVTNFVTRQDADTDAERKRMSRQAERMRHEPVTNLSRIVTNDVTMSVQDIDIDIDIDSIAKEKASFAAQLQSKAGVKPEELQPKKKREPTPKENQRNDLQKYFLMKSGLPLPRDIKELNKMWWTPLTDILTWVEFVQERAEILVDESLIHARKDNLTISSPLSIKKIASDLYAKRNGNGNH